jgi:DNA-binding transcriptional LysR family regulator
MPNLDWYMRANLRPRHLQLLTALDDVRHVGRVAATLNVSQPAISKSLAEMEKGIGVKLFERTARGLHPTIYGESLIRHARSVLAELTLARDELRGLMSGAAGSVSVGTLSAAALTLLPQSLALLKKRSPGTTVLVREGSIESLLPDLWSGKLDMIVGRLPNDQSMHGLGEKILSEDAVTLVAGVGHPLTRRKRVRWSDLIAYPWVLPPVDTLLREPLERAFEQHGVPMPANRIETLSVQIIRAYLQLTEAIAFLAGDVSKHFKQLGLIAMLPLELPNVLRPVGMTWNRQRPLSPSAKLMMQCLEGAAKPPRARRSPSPVSNQTIHTS